jgi:hypothetical protein
MTATPQIATDQEAWPRIEARYAEIKRLAVILKHYPQIDSDEQARSFEGDLHEIDFWLGLLGVHSLSAAVELLTQCEANWQPISRIPPAYYDEAFLRNTIPVLARTGDGSLMIARAIWCDSFSCGRCPDWTRAGRNKRLPEYGSNSITGWLGLDDIVELRNHPNWQSNQPIRSTEA